jgi:hypothetical protein
VRRDRDVLLGSRKLVGDLLVERFGESGHCARIYPTG